MPSICLHQGLYNVTVDFPNEDGTALEDCVLEDGTEERRYLMEELNFAQMCRVLLSAGPSVTAAALSLPQKRLRYAHD